MHAVVRQYTGPEAGKLFDELERRTGEVEQIISGVPGFVAYTLVRTGDGGLSVTVCQDQAGCEESSRRAADWVRQNVTATGRPPEVTEGSVLLQLGGAGGRPGQQPGAGAEAGRRPSA